MEHRISTSLNVYIKDLPANERPRNIDQCIAAIERYIEAHSKLIDKDKGPVIKVIDGHQTVNVGGVPFAIDDCGSN